MMNIEAENNYRIEKELGFGRLAFFLAISFFLCSLFPLSFFAPVPLATALLLYGRKVGLGSIGLIGVAMALASSMYPPMLFVTGVYFFAVIYALCIYLIIEKDMHPVTGMMGFGALLVFIMGVFFAILIGTSDFNYQLEMEKLIIRYFNELKETNSEFLANGGQEARNLIDLLSNPKEVVSGVMQIIPASLFVSTFIGMWAGLFLVLRNSGLWSRFHDYSYSLDELVKFKTPDYTIFVLILGLALVLGGEFISGGAGVIWGKNILYCLSVFYFIQGFGVFIDCLTAWKLIGFFRSFLIIFTIFTGWKFLTAIGLFDIWINFRKFLKNNNEGDK